MSKKFLLSLSYLSLCKFFWTRTENRVIENRVMENRVKRGITVVKIEILYSLPPPSPKKKLLPTFNLRKLRIQGRFAYATLNISIIGR